MIKFENYKNHGIMIDDNEYSIFWFRGKEQFSYDVTKELAEKSRRSDKDALEVMFYLENKRWPKEGELENYNKTDVKTYAVNIGDYYNLRSLVPYAIAESRISFNDSSEDINKSLEVLDGYLIWRMTDAQKKTFGIPLDKEVLIED